MCIQQHCFPNNSCTRCSAAAGFVLGASIPYVLKFVRQIGARTQKEKKEKVNGVSSNGFLVVITVHEHTAKRVGLAHITLTDTYNTKAKSRVMI